MNDSSAGDSNLAISRRQALALGVAGASTALLPRPAPAQETAGGFIDAHVHVWTPDVANYPLSAGWKAEQMSPPSFTPEQLLELARPCGVSRITLIQMSFYRFDNSYMLDSMRRFPGVFSGVAVIDENDSPAEAMRNLKSQGVRGFRIRPEKQAVDRWLDGPGMSAMWKCGAEEGLAMCCLVNPDSLPAIDRMCGKHAETPVVIDHFCRIGASGEIREADLNALCNLAKHKCTAVKLSAFYALGKKQMPYLDLIPMIRKLLDAYGPERLMWATDCPFQVQNGHTYAASIELVRDRLPDLSPGDRDWLLKKTAERVFFS